MPFLATLSGVDFKGGSCRVAISVGNISVRSYPHGDRNILGNLQLNRRFLDKRALTAFFFGDEPLLNLGYDKENVVTAYVSRKVGNGSERITGSFLIEDALRSLDKAVDDLIAKPNVNDSEVELVAQQMDYDRSLGVYNAFTTA